MSVDPMKVTQLAACAPMWRRRDVAAARRTILRTYSHDEALQRLRGEKAKLRPFFTPDFARTTPLVHATRCSFSGAGDAVFPAEEDPNAIVADTGQLGWYDAANRRGVIVVNTPCTQALIGFVGQSNRTTDNLSVDVRNRFCAVQLTSLDDRPIADSARLLLMTTSKATNSDLQWCADRQTVQSWGEGPAAIEPVQGEIELSRLSVDRGRWKITPLTVTGRQQREASRASIEEGRSRLRLGRQACTWRLLEREAP